MQNYTIKFIIIGVFSTVVLWTIILIVIKPLNIVGIILTILASLIILLGFTFLGKKISFRKKEVWWKEILGFGFESFLKWIEIKLKLEDDVKIK